MKPIQFACRATLPFTPAQLLTDILDVTKWPEFQGYGPIPGIKSAVYEVQKAEIVGSRIRVTNLDGSSHLEEIVEWTPDRRLCMRMSEFSPPLSRLATDFLETWEFQHSGNQTDVSRSFELNAKSGAARCVIWMISFLLKKAIATNLQKLSRTDLAATAK